MNKPSALTVRCPYCFAYVGVRCTGPLGFQQTPHHARIRVAARRSAYLQREAKK